MKNRHMPFRSVPLTLAGLPSVSIPDRARLPSAPAVYFVLCGNDIAYIGASINLKDRWRSHSIIPKLAAYVNPRIAWLNVSKKDLFEVESEAVSRLKPHLNQRAGRHKRRITKRIVDGQKTVVCDTAYYLAVD